jgi:hypothetical protein
MISSNNPCVEQITLCYSLLQKSAIFCGEKVQLFRGLIARLENARRSRATTAGGSDSWMLLPPAMSIVTGG